MNHLNYAHNIRMSEFTLIYDRNGNHLIKSLTQVEQLLS